MADGIYRSTDGGASMTRVYTGAASASGARPAGVPSMAIDPTDPNIVYGVADATVKSTNGGNSWTNVRTGSGQVVVVSPSNPKVVYVIGGGELERRRKLKHRADLDARGLGAPDDRCRFLKPGQAVWRDLLLQRSKPRERPRLQDQEWRDELGNRLEGGEHARQRRGDRR